MRQHPTSNYFAGYFAFLAYAGIAVDTSNATTYWNKFLGFQQTAVGPHVGMADYYTKYHDGGGYPEGWEYGPGAMRNLAEPMIAAMTGKSLDLVNDGAHPFKYPIHNASY